MSETATTGDESAQDTARYAGLRYVTGDEHEVRGIRRVPHASGFRYVDSRGRAVTRAEQLERIRALAIPPAWRSVRIAADEKAHIQATGRDQRGRKQYRYHPHWRSTQDEKKFDRLSHFAMQLPELRARIDKDLGLSGLPQDKVVASAVRLLLECHIRVGNEEYARNNRSYGLTTLRNRHVNIDGARIELSFVGKSGKSHHIVVRDNRVARVLERCRRLSGALLFQCVDDAGEVRAISSADINDYLRAVCGGEFSAKDVRTWAGTVMAIRALCEEGSRCETCQRNAKRQLNAALRDVADHLGNTLAICRKCYVHPGVFDLHLGGELAQVVARGGKTSIAGLDADETTALAVLAHLKRRRSVNNVSTGSGVNRANTSRTSQRSRRNGKMRTVR